MNFRCCRVSSQKNPSSKSFHRSHELYQKSQLTKNYLDYHGWFQKNQLNNSCRRYIELYRSCQSSSLDFAPLRHLDQL